MAWDCHLHTKTVDVTSAKSQLAAFNLNGPDTLEPFRQLR